MGFPPTKLCGAAKPHRPPSVRIVSRPRGRGQGSEMPAAPAFYVKFEYTGSGHCVCLALSPPVGQVLSMIQLVKSDIHPNSPVIPPCNPSTFSVFSIR